MNKTIKKEDDHPMLVDIEGLVGLLSCGHATARKIGADAQARIVVGRRVLYLVDKVKAYLENMAE